MKRIMAIAIAMILLLSFSSCGNKGSNVYTCCPECGTDVSKEETFCQNCGALLEDDENKLDDESTNYGHNESSEKQNESPETESSDIGGSTPPVGTSHSHSYTVSVKNPTCTSQGYSTYTCSCGHTYVADYTNALKHSYSTTIVSPTCTKRGYTRYICSCGRAYLSDYTHPAHQYVNYVCSNCGAIDKSHAYAYLSNWVKQRGQQSGQYITLNIGVLYGKSYEFMYDTQNNYLWLTSTETQMTTVLTTLFGIKDGFCGVHYTTYSSGTTVTGDFRGCIIPSTFNKNSAVTYYSYTGPDSLLDNLKELASSEVLLSLYALDDYLDSHSVGITLYDLGYKSIGI